jgi:hypothetical protein
MGAAISRRGESMSQSMGKGIARSWRFYFYYFAHVCPPALKQ